VTAVETALVVALAVLALIGSVSFLQSAAADDLDERASNAGAPDLGVGSTLPATTAAPTSTAPAEPPPPPVSGIAVQASLSGSAAKVGSDWIATVVISVSTSAGTPVPGVSVTAAWSAGVTGLTSCITLAGGSCSVSSNEIDRRGKAAVPSVTLTLTDVSGSGVTWSQTAPATSVAAP
jgi:hypothetical protein